MNLLTFSLRATLLMLISAAASLAAQTTPSPIHSFSGSNGDAPNSLIQAEDGHFYGTTFFGGNDQSCTDGTTGASVACCVDDKGNTTGCGTVFRLEFDNSVTVLHSFSGGPDGASPTGLIQGGDGNLYGTTAFGGSPLNPNACTENDGVTSFPCCLDNDNFPNNIGCGTIFQLQLSGSNFSTLYSFNGGADGAFPNRPIQGSDGNFYTTTSPCNNTNGCPFVYGQIVQFESSTSGSWTLNPLKPSFSWSNGAYPNAIIEGSDQNFYGTTFLGGGSLSQSTGDCAGFGCGVVFKFTPAASSSGTGSLTDVCTFAASIGGVDTRSAALGKELLGGRSSLRVKPETIVVQPGRGFPVGDNTMSIPFSPNVLVEGSDSESFYGTTPPLNLTNVSVSPSTSFDYGGSIFQCSPSGSAAGGVTNIYPFSGANGTLLGLTLGTDGNYYGMSANTIFEITPASISASSSLPLTSLPTAFTFSSAAGSSPDSLTQGNDGNFYGTAAGGLLSDGSAADGTIYEIAVTPALRSPVQLSLSPASISLGDPTTLTWKVLNAFSVTAQQCYAFVQNATPGAGTWTGSQTKNGSLSADIFSGQATITPTAVGTYTYAMTCAGTESGSASLTVNAPPPLTFTPPALLSGTVGTTYTATMNANGGVKPYTWSWSPVSGSSLPPGLTLAPNTGVLTGTPSQSGTFNFSVEVADSQSTPATQTASLSLAIAPQPPPSISADPTTVTITSPGASGSTKLSFSNFSGGTVSLTCSGLPKGATCSTLSPTGTSATLQISTTGASAMLHREEHAGVFLAIAIPGALLLLWGVPSRNRRLGVIALLVVVLELSSALTGCGGGSSTTGGTVTPTGTFPLSVTATSGTQSASVSISLVVN